MYSVRSKSGRVLRRFASRHAAEIYVRGLRAQRSPSPPSSIEDLITKYMQLLRIDGKRPVVKLRSNIGSRWLGRDTGSTRDTSTTLLEIQKSALHDPRTLERVIAHEMVHHRDHLRMTPREWELVKFGIRPAAHGKEFLEGAAEINAVMGPDFVTVLSDQEYVRAPLAKSYWLLIVPFPTPTSSQLGYAWAAKMSAEATVYANEKLAKDGAVILQVTDEAWATGSKARIKKYGGLSIPKPGTEKAAALQALYQQIKKGQ